MSDFLWSISKYDELKVKTVLKFLVNKYKQCYTYIKGLGRHDMSGWGGAKML